MKKKNRIKALFTTVLLAVCTVCMADDEQITKQINSIIGNSQYLYAENYATTEEQARQVAEDLLEVQIKQWTEKKKKLRGSSNFVINNKKSFRTALSVSRGRLVRVFVYVKKSDIIAGSNTSVVNVGERTNEANVERISSREESSVKYSEVAKLLTNYSEFSTLYNRIKQLNEEGKIKKFARYTDLSDPQQYHLAIFDMTTKKVKAILTSGQQRRNVATGQIDSEKKYSGCGAVGFIPNK
ncbi:MAG: hypothetical protein IJ199_06450 [Prevotella sp.]|nr:hypothetical protein [Prevotella sp.]